MPLPYGIRVGGLLPREAWGNGHASDVVPAALSALCKGAHVEIGGQRFGIAQADNSFIGAEKLPDGQVLKLHVEVCQ